MSNNDFWALPASEIVALVRSRTASAEEVARAALGRLDAVNPMINAVVAHHPEEVIARAIEVDEAIARGEAIGPLAGVPVTIKVNTDQIGFATTNGIKAQRDLVAKANSPIVDNFLRAGAVPLGRTNTPAFSARWFTSNLLHGATLNPRDSSLTPGGSSGGAASAVAAGIGAIAHGSDIAGSIRYPAYACGVHGLRPSLGRVAAFNATASLERPIGPQLMSVGGPIARSVGDLRLGLEALMAPDERDPWWTPSPLRGRDVPRRAAVCFRPDGMNTAEVLCTALLESAERLRDAGWVVEEVDALPPLREASALNFVLWMGDGFDAMLAAAEREGDQGAIIAFATHKHFSPGVTLNEFSAALSRRLAIARLWNLFFERYPVVLMPTSSELPFKNELDLEGPEAYARILEAQMTMIGLPAIGLPGLALATGSTGRTPIGIQIVAGRFREDLCLDAAEAIEARSERVLPVDPIKD